MAPTPRTVGTFNRTILPQITQATSGQRVLEDVKRIVETDRWNSFDRFHDTTQTLLEAYRSAGARTEIYNIPTGGPIGSGRWIIPKASDIRSATLDIIHPIKKRVLNYQNNPWHVIQWSAATPPDGLTCDLIIIDEAKQLQSMRPGSLRNKLVLTRLNIRSHLKTFADLGAIGIVCDAHMADLPRATAWTKFGWGAINMAHANIHLVGLVLSGAEGDKLRKHITQKGPLTVRVRVDIRDYTGSHDLVSGLIKGQDDPQDEVWVLAHSAEPGAIDNASGVALCIEIARVLERLIAQNKLPRPKRTIRLLSGYECYSFFNYVEHTRRFQTPLAGVCIDTVGARPDICAGQLSWRSTIPMSATFVDRLGESILRATLRQTKPGYKLKPGPFVSTSDTLLGDPQYGFPCPWITTHYREGGKTWKAYHSSADIPALLSASGLKACTAGMAAYLYFLADAGTREALDLANSETRYFQTQLASVKTASEAAYLRNQHQTSLQRLQRWLWEGHRNASLKELDGHTRIINEAGPQPAKSRKRISQRAKCVPHRTAPIAPTLENTPPPIAERIRKSGLQAWALFWADGTRTLSDIAECLQNELVEDITEEQVAACFDAHRDLEYVRLIQPHELIAKSQLTRDLRTLGIKRGMDILVHSSLSAIGHVEGGANTVIDAICDIIGKTGTLMMPSFNHRRAHTFNPQTTPSTNGAIPDAFWRRPNVMRSMQPTHAWAAYGPKAEWLCADHLTNGTWTANSPLSRFIHDGGYILSLGVDHTSSTAYHAAEMSMPCSCNDPFGHTDRIVQPNGAVAEVPGLAFRNGKCPVSPDKLNAALKNRQQSGKVGHADATLVKAYDLFQARRRHLKKVCPTCPIKPRYPK